MHGELGLLSRPLVLRGSELLPEYTVFAKRLISTPFTASLRDPFESRLLEQLLDGTSDPANGPLNARSVGHFPSVDVQRMGLLDADNRSSSSGW